MKIIKVILGTLIMMMAASCHSPSRDGNKAANMENECEENCIEAIRDLHREFTDDFTPSAYTSRRQALEEFERRLEEICDNYYLEINDVEIEKGLLRSPYIESNKGLEKFDEAYFRARQPEAFRPALGPQHLACDSTTLPSQPRLCTYKGRERTSSSQVPSTAERRRGAC